MKKKELKKQLDVLSRRVLALESTVKGCHYCENYKQRTVVFKRYIPLGNTKDFYTKNEVKNEAAE